jgi:hypothetical protein
MSNIESTSPSQQSASGNAQLVSMNVTIEQALVAFVQQSPQEASSIINDLAKSEQEFQHSQQVLLNESTIRTEREQVELLRVAVEARASKDNAEAEKIRNAEIPRGLAETEQIKSQAALNLQRAATMKNDGINKRIVAVLFLGGGAWSLYTGQPPWLTLGLALVAAAIVSDISGVLKQIKGKSPDKD